jgi:RNA polymerase sigma factor (sigma-70 family)
MISATLRGREVTMSADDTSHASDGSNAPESSAASAGGLRGEPSDALLISRIRDDDSSAYGPLYRRHLAAARRLAGRLVNSESEIADAVAETFARVLDVLRRGGGPQIGFRPYLLAAVRRIVDDRCRSDGPLASTDRIGSDDPGEPFADPALQGLEQNMIARAFRSLPERWQTVLWHTEIEGERPADVAPLLGHTANAVAGLAYRAREGLRQAYLQLYLAEVARRGCRPALDRLGAYIRGGLARPESAQVQGHLGLCPDCEATYAELADVGIGLRTIVAPFFLGTAATAYLAGSAYPAETDRTAVGGILDAWHHLPKREQQTLGAGAATVVAAAVVGLFLVSHEGQVRPAGPPLATAPGVPPPEPGPGRQPPPEPGAMPPRAGATPPRPGAPLNPVPTVKPVAQRSPRPTEARAELAARINPVGALVRGRDGIVAISVRNVGEHRSKSVIADMTLPPGTRFVRTAFTTTASGRWTCAPERVGEVDVTCAHDPIEPGHAASAYLRVNIAPDAPSAGPPLLVLRSYGVSIGTRGDEGVRPTGLPARFAADGNMRTAEVGNALLSCGALQPGCAEARARGGHLRDDDLWDMRPLDLDRDATTRSSSSARISLPGKVVWAGLYWSGAARGGGAVTARVRAPRSPAYTTVRAGAVGRARLRGLTAYQAFADVTSLVRRHGGGQWWVADAPARSGPGQYAGWSLVVVVRDSFSPTNQHPPTTRFSPTNQRPSTTRHAPRRQVMVLDGTYAVGTGTGRTKLDAPIAGLTSGRAPARLGVIGWEGDAEMHGDQLLLNGSPLTPAGGDRHAGNVFDSSAAGAAGPPLTFGADVEHVAATLTGRPVLTLTTSADAFLVGVVTVTAPMRGLP